MHHLTRGKQEPRGWFSVDPPQRPQLGRTMKKRARRGMSGSLRMKDQGCCCCPSLRLGGAQLLGDLSIAIPSTRGKGWTTPRPLIFLNGSRNRYSPVSLTGPVAQARVPVRTLP